MFLQNAPRPDWNKTYGKKTKCVNARSFTAQSNVDLVVAEKEHKPIVQPEG